MREQYLDYEIVYEEGREEFFAYKDGVAISHSESLKVLKDRLTKEDKIKFPKVDVYYKRYNEYINASVTSKTDDGEVWVSYNEGGKKKREKLREYYRVSILTADDTNKTIISAIKILKKEIDQREEEINNLDKKMNRFDFNTYKPLEESK